MLIEQLRVAAFVVYLVAWIVFAVAAVSGALRGRRRQVAASAHMTVLVGVGILLQSAAVFAITLSMSNQPLRPQRSALAGTLALAPFAASVFVWTLRSGLNNVDAETLVTRGAYGWLRHPMYLAFLAMLLATGFLVSGGLKLVASVAIYLAGTELRIASEEEDRAKRFPADYAKYRLRTRWRYLPGLR